MTVDPHEFNAALAHEQAGRLAQAEEGYRRILSGGGEAAVIHFNLGNVQHRRGRSDAAVESYRRAVAIRPREIFFHVNLGHALSHLERHGEAADAYRAALALRPHEPDLQMCLAAACHRTGDDDGAAAALEAVLRLDPERREARVNLGHLRHRQGDLAAAADLFSRALEQDPDDPTLRHLLAAVTGQQVAGAPDEHVRRTFDQLSDRYDHHLLEVLGSRVARRLRELVEAFSKTPAIYGNVLDLGCGTGISGQELRPLAARITGVDLSAKMVALARGKGVYDRLVTDGIVAFLEAGTAAWDLVVAADVFAYMGRLDPVFQRLSGACLPGAPFVFSTEAADGSDDWRLLPSGRFGHRRAYVERLAAAWGFELLACCRERLRREAGAWVEGYLFVLKKRNVEPRNIE